MPGSKVIAFIQNNVFQKMEMFVSEIWTQIFHNIEIAQGAWNFYQIVFGTSLATYKTNKFKKLNTGSPM